MSAACAGAARTANPQSTKLPIAAAKDRPDDADNRQIGLIHAPSKARGDPSSLVGKVQCFCELRDSAKKQQPNVAGPGFGEGQISTSDQWNL